MHPIPKPTSSQDKPTISQWGSTLKRRLVPQVRRAVRNSEHRGEIIHREGKSDSKRWARSATAQLLWERRKAFRMGVIGLYGEGCLHPLKDGTLCGEPGEAHHCYFGERRRQDVAQQDKRNGTMLCRRRGHHAEGAEAVHDCKTPGEGEKWRRHWERFSDIAFEEGPEAALAWNRTTQR